MTDNIGTDYIPKSGKEQDQLLFSKPVEEKVYLKKDFVFSVMCVLLGYLFIKLVLPNIFGIYLMIFNVFFSILAIVYFKKSKVKISKTSYVLLGIIILFNSNFIISSNYSIKSLNILFVISLIIYWIFITATHTEAFKNSFVIDFLKSAFEIPFSSYGDCSKAIVKSSKSTRVNKNVIQIIIGLLLAIPVTVVVASLLLNADDAFKHLFNKMFSNIGSDILTFILQFGLGLLVASYLFGLLYANINKTYFKKDKVQYQSTTRIFEPVILYSAVTPICVLYVLFFLSQSTYFLSAFQNKLPTQFSYADYARKGFFELFAVSLINLAILFLLNLFCKLKNDKKPKGLTFFNIVISVLTLLLITTALSKMGMYINNYGLTKLRVYTSWFMVLLAIIFIIIIVTQFIKKTKVVKAIAVSFIIMFGILNFSDVDGIIANYNITQYQNGSIKELDINIMYDLSDSAVQYVAPLVNSKNLKISTEARQYMIDKSYEVNGKFSNFNFSSNKAYKVLKEYKFA